MVERIQRLWRAKRVFTNNQGTWKISKPHVVSTISITKFPVDMGAVFAGAPRGFTEVTGFKGAGQKASIRYADGKWIGSPTGVTRVTAKRGPQTVVITKGVITVLGAGNPEAAYIAIAKNGWSAKNLIRAKPEYRKVDGVFYINKPFNLSGLKQEIQNELSLNHSVIYHPEVKAVPAVVLKLKNPQWTYQFFENGTVLFTGIKDPKDVNEPVRLFKQFFTEFEMNKNVVIRTGKTPAIQRPVAGKKNAAKLAERYPLAGTWNSLRKPYAGFYIRPGANGKPRMYPYRFMRRNTNAGVVNLGPMNLRAVAPKVVKAFRNVGQPIPKVTLDAFASAGVSLGSPKKKAVAAHANRRAPSWSATKNGFYVRPGAGQQPYWFKVPAGLASGRKTVIDAYTKAGRNMPAAVRAIFKIPANVTINVKPKHNVTMGLNGILRINGRQAIRLTVPELVAVARNMNIAQVNAKMKPAEIIGWIQGKSGARTSKNYNVNLNGTKYKLLSNGRVEKTVGTKRTTRNWSTIPAANQNRIAKAFLNESYHGAYNLQPRNKKYSALMLYKNSLRAATPSTTSSSASSNNNNLANFAANLEATVRNQGHKNAYRALVGNYYTNENANRLLTRLGKMPAGAKQANVNRAIKTFSKEAVVRARRALIKANYKAKLTVPNWLPANKRNEYKNVLLNIALEVNNKGKYPTQKKIREGMQAWINAKIPKVPTVAHTKENALTGATVNVPAWNPPKKISFNVPKRISPPRPAVKPRAPKAAGPSKPKAKKNTSKRRLNENSNNAENIGSAMIALGINTKGAYAWNNLVRAGMNKRYKNAWARQKSV
jgi:TATA-box binding protein (TBP) (component of TFIID and TFIIIB)